MRTRFIHCDLRRCAHIPVTLLVLAALLCTFPAWGQRRGFDYREDRQRAPESISLTLESAAYELETTEIQSLDRVFGGEILRMEGFEQTTSPGNPILPFRMVDVAVPPNIDWSTLRLTVENVEFSELRGTHVVPPAPPERARADGEEIVYWGTGKQIVDGRNREVYAADTLYPAESVTILATSEMRKWMFVRIGFSPVQYNPVSGRLRLVHSAQVRLDFERIGTRIYRADPLLRDTLADAEAKRRFKNFARTKEWYRYQPLPEPGPTPVDPDYVIITSNAVRDGSNAEATGTTLADFIAHKTTLGHMVQLVTEDEYGALVGDPPHGTAEKIRQWLQDNYAALGIHYVLLVGDPDPDDPTDATDSVGDVPMKMMWPWVDYWRWRETPTDHYYADLSGNWDLDGDGLFGEAVNLTNPTSPDAAIGADTFSVRWTGRVEVDTAGVHSFLAFSDDGMRVRVDGSLLIDEWGPHGPGYTTASVDLTVGQHDLEVEYREETGEGMMSLNWFPPGANGYGIVPSTKLYRFDGVSWVPGGIEGEYFNNSDFTAPVLSRVDPYLSFYWGTGDQGTGGPDFAPELFVGRIPVYDGNYSALNGILQKTVDFDNEVATGWRRSFLTANVELWPGQSDWQLGEALKTDFADPLGFTSYRIYESDFGLVPPPECPAINAKDVDPAAPCNMLQEWTNGGGYGVLTWSTHGGSTSASHLIASADNVHLDDDVPTFTFHGSCNNGFPENSNNLGYALLAQGAIGTVSASRVSTNSCFNPTYDPNPTSGSNANLTYHYAMRIMTGNSAGHALYLTKTDVTPSSGWKNKMDYNLYGDPAAQLLRLWGGVVLVFDSSGSMSWTHEGHTTADPDERRITLAKEAAYPFLELLDDYTNSRTNFGLSRFPPQPWTFAVGCNGQVVTPMTLVDAASIATAVTTTVPGLTTDGDTPLLAGIEEAMTMFGTETNRTIVLLSDGYHNCPSTVDVTDPAVTSLIDDLKTNRVKVYTIGFGRPTDVDHPLLETLATETGGRFYDVTTAAFDPTTWGPATGLQDTYKRVLVDALTLQSPADPTGIIRAGQEIVREVPMSGYDRQVSFYLSWVTPQPNRLGLRVIASDGTELPMAAASPPGLRVHNGRTYTIITLDRGFLRQTGKVGPTPWQLVINADNLSQDEEEKYQYSVILDSRLEMEASFDRTGYQTGDPILLAARLVAGSKPVKGATVEVQVTRPQDGAGNWYHAHRVTERELAQVPAKIGAETLSDLQRKATFLADIRGVAFPGRLTADQPLRLYDDGTHGDALADDGVYTNRYDDTVREGTHGFFFQANGEAAGGSFVREAKRETLVSVRVSPDHLLVGVERLKDAERLSRYRIVVTPKDALGNYLGPRHGGRITLTASQGRFVSGLRDDLSGGYEQILELPRGIKPADVDILVNVGDVNSSFNLGRKVGQRFGASVHLGTTIPRGALASSYDGDWGAALDLEYNLTTDLSLVGVLGYSRFKAAHSSLDDTSWWNLSGMLKYEVGRTTFRPFAEIGIGAYKPESGSTKLGGNLGLGLRFDPQPAWAIELAVDYHRVFTSGDDVEYFTPQIRWIYVF